MNSFSDRLLEWFHRHGRKNLPWQQQPTGYRVWISEIMLQQTQVQTVIPFYEQFMQRFPDLNSLATASLDEVLHYWSGLGYYARARNLHKAAQMITMEYQGEFPPEFEMLQQLPGIGRSTAAAIVSLAFQQRQPILDGNVKRVLTRYHALEGWPGQSAISKRLWELADDHTPVQEVGAYTQAIMDLGATLCTRSNPSCESCPVREDCQANQTGRQMEFPFSKPRKKIPTRKTHFIIIRDSDNGLLLQKRPPAGIWGGLWAFPECEQFSEINSYCARCFGFDVLHSEILPTIKHTFSHFHLQITPVMVETEDINSIVMEPSSTLWYNRHAPKSIGLATPVAALLRTLNGETP